MSKHRGIRLSVIVLLLALIVTACGGGSSGSGNNGGSGNSSGTGTGTAKQGPAGTLTVIQGAEPDRLDPLFSDGSAEYTVVVNIMEGLFTTGPNLEVVPMLADSWKTIDDVTWEFKLKQGVKFHNGEPFNAEAVKYSYHRALDPNEKVRNAWAGDINLKEVKVIDEYTVQFITKEPTPHVLARLANDHFMYPPNYTREVKSDFTKKPIGTGPYKFKEWTKGDRIVLEANPDYWGKQPAIKEAIWRFVPEDGARLAELETGNADIITLVPPEKVDALKGKAKTDVVAIEGGRRVYLGMRTQGNVPTADKRVRQAINYGIDVESIAKNLLGGTVSRMKNPVNPPNQNPAVTGYKYDPELAKKLLAEAGYANGFQADLEAYLGTALKDREFLQAVVADLRKIGVNLNLKIQERSVFNDNVKERKNGPFYLRSTAPGYDLGVDLILFRPNHSGNGTLWEPKEFTDLYQKVFTTVDPAKRKEHANAIQKLIVEEAPWVFLWRQPEIYGVNPRVKGFNPQGDERIRVAQLSLAK